MIASIDESGNPSVNDPLPFVLSIALIQDEEGYKEGYENISLKLFNKMRIFKYSADKPKKDDPKGVNVKGLFIESISPYVSPISIVIEKHEDIKNLVIETYGKLIANHLSELIVNNPGSSKMKVVYDKVPLFTSSDKQFITTNFYRWMKVAKSLRPHVVVDLSWKDRDIWISAADYVTGITRDSVLCGKGLVIREYCDIVEDWIGLLKPKIRSYTTEEVKVLR
ncbi:MULTISPECIES: hypothetical protein [Metallosphaera]|uniref:DUF3800 domain-containing protein n=3 Tax=Metallosphaera TaxID=41980 RepID=A4YE53_METS5|nr:MULTISPECIES: hypothetical protein [Metallosphaera]ABP94705.1 hypothetical protein Msed_0530 [Metallosphaera sedula DSM 5348]AIM26692.1 hypothetical protein HA72_0530 [Metallosphaera sedula]AKV73654.1 hypothetical protein MsedA_0542 [Metallosphaera sedula]AKV75894.1 hypothetical protein MsedB_0542 [Metallosphaera sedula]AKV78145.1 hypothetical protein MsedC_0541 [Metallosphaera sedula]